MTDPYWSDGTCSLYLGDCREVLPALGVLADCVVADPPYGETSLPWDRWPEGWLDVAARVTSSLWCFGSLRMFLKHAAEFAGWKLSQDIVIRKAVPTSFARDRFRRRHEIAAHWYRGPWGAIWHDVPLRPYNGPSAARRVKGGARPGVHGELGNRPYIDTGMRLATSVLDAPNSRILAGAGGRAAHNTRKAPVILADLITYACPRGGLVIDPFAGSGSTLEAARATGRRAIGIEADERYAERAASRLARPAQLTLDELEAAVPP